MAGSIQKLPRPGHWGFDVYRDGRHIGWYYKRLPNDGRGYAYRANNGGYGTVVSARAAIDALAYFDGR